MSAAVITLGSLALMSAPWRVLRQGTNVPPPPLRRQAVGTLFRDGETIVAAALSNRTLTLRVMLNVGRGAPGAAHAYLSALHDELDEFTNTLHWEPVGGGTAVVFNTFRAPDWQVVEQDWGLGLHTLDLVIPAEPLAEGGVFAARYTVAHDPAAGPVWFDVPGAQGDALTPTVLTVDDDGTGVHRVLATRRHGDPGEGAWVVAPAHLDAAGGDKAGTRKFATTYPPPKLGPRGGKKRKPDAASVLGPDHTGKYRVFAQLTATDPDATAAAWMSWGDPANDAGNGTKATVTGPGTFWHNLGVIAIPYGTKAPKADLHGRPRHIAPAPVHLHHDGPGIEWGHLVFMPVDAELCYLLQGPGDPSRLVVDGVHRSCYRTDPTTGAVLSSTPHHAPHHRGGLPHLAPGGQTTRVLMLTGFAGGAPAPEGETGVEVAYRSLHRNVPPLPGDPQR